MAQNGPNEPRVQAQAAYAAGGAGPIAAVTAKAGASAHIDASEQAQAGDGTRLLSAHPNTVVGELRIREARWPDDIAAMIAAGAREGWNPSTVDARIFYAADPTGFFVGEIGSQRVSYISVVKYGSMLAFVGFYLVEPAFRSRGHGLATWRHCIASAGGRALALDAVLARVEDYTREGFTPVYRHIRHQVHAPVLGQPRGALMLALDAAVTAQRLRLVPAAAVPRGALLAYDLLCFGAPRPAFWEAYLSSDGVVGVAAVAEAKEGSRADQQASGSGSRPHAAPGPGRPAAAVPAPGAAAAGSGWQLLGLAMARPCTGLWKMGPLFADSAPVADALLSHVLLRLPPGDELVVDVPEPHQEAMQWAASRRGMIATPVIAMRMHKGQVPPHAADKVFGNTTWELG
jgi:GNAT superfamily N-acetyltransferase